MVVNGAGLGGRSHPKLVLKADGEGVSIPGKLVKYGIRGPTSPENQLKATWKVRSVDPRGNRDRKWLLEVLWWGQWRAPGHFLLLLLLLRPLSVCTGVVKRPPHGMQFSSEGVDLVLLVKEALCERAIHGLEGGRLGLLGLELDEDIVLLLAKCRDIFGVFERVLLQFGLLGSEGGKPGVEELNNSAAFSDLLVFQLKAISQIKGLRQQRI